MIEFHKKWITNSCLIIKEKNVYLTANKGKIAEGVAYFEKPGTFKFYCPSSKVKGKIVVLKKPTKNNVDRKTASKVKYWYPKEK